MARTPYDALAYPEPLDVIFTAQNYHDMPLTAYALGDRARMNATAFAALKPGGVYIIIDHSAVDGQPVETDAETTNAPHRSSDLCAVKWKPRALCSTAKAMCCAIPADARARLSVFDPAIRGSTDQFMMRFRKPE